MLAPLLERLWPAGGPLARRCLTGVPLEHLVPNRALRAALGADPALAALLAGTSGSILLDEHLDLLCRIDAGSKYGQAVAQAFETTTLPYTAIIDKRAERILFSKAGQFTATEWSTTLTSHWRGERLVSYQPVVSQPVQAAFCST